MMTARKMIAALLLMMLQAFAAERINHEGRILGPQLPVTAPILFNTPQADAVVSSMQIMPVTSAWNEDISKRPLLPNSDAMISRIISDLDASRRNLRVFFEMNYVLAPDNQPVVPIDFAYYPDQSDPSPYPIPTNMPVETWPRETGALTLRDWQLDVNGEGGDRHSIIVQPGAGFIWETWLTLLRSNGQWEAANGAKFDLKSNTLRPLTWTSADAAGLPMFPALVKYDECQRGMVEHAMRIVVKKSRREFIYPATHFASTNAASLTNIPAMGQRVRLKESFAIPGNWTTPEKAVLKGLKKYGALVADNGNFFSISAVPDDRWAASEFSHLSSINITNFEVIQTTGAAEGPRSPGAPRADAGPDRTVAPGVPIKLDGSVSFTTQPIVQWRLYSGPASVTFDDASKTNATATLSAVGQYILMLSANDGIHAVAYDAAIVTVANALTASITRSANTADITWSGSAASYVVEQTTQLGTIPWTPVLTTSVYNASIPFTNQIAFYRIREQ
jgi:hypothetical protein